MNVSNRTPPERMTAEQRRAEVASYLALGLVRLRGGQNIAIPPESGFDLGFGERQRVHTASFYDTRKSP